MMPSFIKTKQAAVEVQLLTVRAKNNIVLSENGEVINPHLPIWNNKKVCTVPVPVAFAIGTEAPPQLEVQLGFTAGQEKGILEILSVSGGLLFSGSVTEEGYVLVDACDTPGALAQLQDDLLFVQLITDSGEITALGTIPAEIYWVSLDGLSATLYKNGMPLEMLRTLCSMLSLICQFPAGEAYMYPVQAIVHHLFHQVPPRYDIWGGAARFITVNGWNNITLHYNAYLAAQDNSGAVVSAYDMAAILQYLLQCYGYRATYCYIQPFGYLALTSIHGRGLCNSPFYGACGGTAVTNQLSAARTALGNHTFVYLPAHGVVADATLGPHVGNETPQAYLTGAIDTLHPDRAIVPAGSVADIQYFTGVTSVNLIHSLYALPDFPHTAAFMESTGISGKGFAALANRTVAGKWPEPAAAPLLQGKWKSFYREVVPGTEEVLRMWMLQKGGELLHVKLYVSSGSNDLAFNRFISLGALSQGASPGLAGDDRRLGHYSAAAVHKHDNRYLWVYHNVVLDISCSDDSVDLAEIAAWYFAWASNHLVADVQMELPHTEISCSVFSALYGGQMMVSLEGPENTLLEFAQAGKGLRLVRRESKNLVFDVLDPAATDLQVIVIDSDSLLVKTLAVLPPFAG